MKAYSITPSLVVLIGGGAKSAALQVLTSVRKTRKYAASSRRRQAVNVNLHISSPCIVDGGPIFVAEGDIPYHAPKERPRSASCHETVRFTLPRIREGALEPAITAASEDIYSRLLCPFADVICFFAVDFDGYVSIARHLAACLDKGQPSTLPKTTYPRLLIVTEAQVPGPASDEEAKDVFLQVLREETVKGFQERFSTLEVVTVLPEGTTSASEPHYDRLREHFKEAVNEVRAARAEARMLFSARHFAAFFDYACDHFSKTTREPFDFIKTSRLRNPVPAELDEHLCNFLKRIESPEEVTEFAVPVIASSLLLDHYPPGMHADDRWLLKLHTCRLCGFELPDVTFRVKPDNAGISVLSIDGGGVRGIMPLQFLQILQDRIGLPIPVQEHFDVAFGTSSGGLITLALFLNGWSADDCANVFESLAKKAFKPRWYSCIPVLSQIPFISHFLILLASLLADGVYPPEDLEAALKNVFDSARGIQDYSYAMAIGAKIGIPVTTIMETDFCLFTNYNGDAPRHHDCGYSIVRPKDGSRKILLWEIARSTSAAPWYFKPKHIPGVGTFQDGGLWKNNPVDIALWEIPVIWPSIERPDLVISLGTGSLKARKKMGFSGLWSSRLLARLYGCLDRFISSKKIAEEFGNGRRKELDGRYFRFDGELSESSGLDETDKIRQIAAYARDQFCRSPEIDVVARRIIASLFYVELDRQPRKIKDKYFASGHIFCRVSRTQPAFEHLMNQLSKTCAVFSIDGHVVPGRVEDRSFTDGTGNFRKKIEFEGKERLSIHLKEGSFQPQHISGSPYVIEEMIRAQGLNKQFGRSDHLKRCDPEPQPGPPSKRRRIW
ncbi:putative patatin-like phospholipase [Phaeomoniella chlamydospora]|uniref:Putative patatin-like phospholipase n=1 Tax=Phaeomoniella chlamydospora TaxID=158046 RepID=A0A0G2F339_PHACM|nr:putative patatin-like phospholipase [Phaeomoniella chlamydospora]